MSVDSTGRSAENSASVRRVLIQILWLNLLVTVAKAAYGVASGSLAVTSDALHSLLDAGSNGIGLAANKVADRPPNPKHPYGYRRVEIIAAAIIGLVILVGAARFAWGAVEQLIADAPPPEVTAVGYVVLIGTLVINVFVAAFESRRGRELKSHFLVADAAHTASDVVVTIAVIISQVLVSQGVVWADSVVALGVIVVIGRIGWSILKSNLATLLDRAIISSEELTRVAMEVKGAEDVHRVRSRGSPAAVHVDLHLHVRGEMPLRDAHELSHEVEERIRGAFPQVVDVVIHVEPAGDPDEGL